MIYLLDTNTCIQSLPANNLILVTHNTREFSRIEELRLEDWEVEV